MVFLIRGAGDPFQSRDSLFDGELSLAQVHDEVSLGKRPSVVQPFAFLNLGDAVVVHTLILAARTNERFPIQIQRRCGGHPILRTIPVCGRLRDFILVEVIDVQIALRGDVGVVIPVEQVFLVQLGDHHRFIEEFARVEVVILHFNHEAGLVQRVEKQVTRLRFALGILHRQDGVIGLIGPQPAQNHGA